MPTSPTRPFGPSARAGLGVGPTLPTLNAGRVPTSCDAVAGLRGGDAGPSLPRPPAPTHGVRHFGPAEGDWLPPWAREQVDQDATVEDLVRAAVDQATSAPSEATFVEVRRILNELGRTTVHTETVKRVVKKAVRKQLLRGGGKR
jgi:hypothetical protein